MEKDTVLRARALIGERTPLRSDCGQLCGAACCQADEDGQGGMYLFPGEEALLHGEDSDFAPIYTCDGTCARENRPLACRIFPLTPVKPVYSLSASHNLLSFWASGITILLLLLSE